MPAWPIHMACLRFYGGASPAESIVPATAAAKKALELDDSLAEAHASLGLIATEELEVHRAVERTGTRDSIKSELRHGPPLARPRASRRWGNRIGLLRETKRALELDPLSMVINADTSVIFTPVATTRPKHRQKTLEIDPRSFLAHYYSGWRCN